MTRVSALRAFFASFLYYLRTLLISFMSSLWFCSAYQCCLARFDSDVWNLPTILLHLLVTASPISSTSAIFLVSSVSIATALARALPALALAGELGIDRLGSGQALLEHLQVRCAGVLRAVAGPPVDDCYPKVQLRCRGRA